LIQSDGERLGLITKLHFSRFEFKYLLPAGLRREVESELSHFVELDPYVAGKENHQYLVRSLYFDDWRYSNYYEKIDGMMKRAKFRVRTYTDDPAEDCATFLEVKGRYGGLVFKHRSPLSDPAVGELSASNGNPGELIAKRAESGPVVQQFRFEVERKRLRPCMLIDYARRPYMSRYAPEFRLTFDDELRATHTQLLHPRREQRRSILPGYTILEVKFRFHVPSWFHRIIQSYELGRVSISKYCRGVEAFRLTPHLE
jgi:hypothetical protein